MQIDFAPLKDASNLSKHGVSLALAAELDWDAALVWVDDRTDYGEARMIALAPKTAILYFVAFVDRSTVRRIISLRRANRREAKHYVKATEEILRADPDSRR
ncbi:MAG: BrnT family toxin [Cyanobium sp. CZS 48M]|nr:BrnT family toxin [Cyanobium sp. CZS48M]